MTALPWGHRGSAELLALAAELLGVGDRRGPTLLAYVLERECGPAFAAAVSRALAAGTPPEALGFLPAPRAAPGRRAPRRSREPGGPRLVPIAPEVAAALHDAPPAAGDRPALPADDGGQVRTAGTDGATPPGRVARAADASGVAAATEAGGAPAGRNPPPLPATGYVSAREVAAHFGVTSKAVYRWMANGRIRAERRPGGSYRIPADQFHGRPADGTA